MHEPKTSRQHTLDEPMEPQVRPSAQQFGAESPGVQEAPSPSEHTGVTQLPPVHKSAPRQQ